MLDEIPPEVLTSVFLLCHSEQVSRVALVNRALRAANRSEVLWAALYLKEFNELDFEHIEHEEPERTCRERAFCGEEKGLQPSRGTTAFNSLAHEAERMPGHNLRYAWPISKR
jgi:hypothetical protein